MSTATAEIVKQRRNNTTNPHVITKNYDVDTTGYVVTRLDMGAFNVSTNPEGIQGLGSSDTIILGEVNRVGARRKIDNRSGAITVKSLRIYADAAVALGTANNFTLRIVRSANSTLPNVDLGTIAETSLTANAIIEGPLELYGLLLETGDKIVLVPDGDISAGAVPGTDIYAEIVFVRQQKGSRIDTGLAVA